MQNLTEWTVNHALHTFFHHSLGYMLVFQDQDFHAYLDRHLIPMAQFTSKKKINRTLVKTNRDRYASIDPQQLRPDAILVDKTGKPIILETKLGRINAKADCLALIVQTLVYADLIVSPRWLPPGRSKNAQLNTTYDLLEDLHESHHFLKVFGEGKYRLLEKRHQAHFRLPKPLSKVAFSQKPSVILLLEDVNLPQLQEEVNQVRKLGYLKFKGYAERELHKRSNFRKRLQYLELNWPELQSIEFSLMKLDTNKFQSVIDQSITPL